MATTKEQIEKALKQLTPHPLQHWHINKDGTITAINTIGQKFILTPQTIQPDEPPPNRRQPGKPTTRTNVP